MMCTSVIPCFPSSLATSNNIMSMFILFSWLFGFGFFGNGWKNLAPKQSNRIFSRFSEGTTKKA